MSHSVVRGRRRRAVDPSQLLGHVQTLAALAEQVYEGQEEEAVDAALVKLGRAAVGGGDDDGAVGPHGREQTVQHKGIRHVRDLELVEADQGRRRHQVLRDRQQRVARRRLAAITTTTAAAAVAAAELVHAFVHAEHEAVKVRASDRPPGPSAVSREIRSSFVSATATATATAVAVVVDDAHAVGSPHVLNEEVHDGRLARPHLARQVHAPRRPPLADEAPHGARGAAVQQQLRQLRAHGGPAVAPEGLLQRGQVLERRFLGRIRLTSDAIQEVPVAARQ